VKHFLLALQHALFALVIQLGLVLVIETASSGTRGQALGACIATLSLLVSGFVLGLRARRIAAEKATGEHTALLAGRSRLEVLSEVLRSGSDAVPWSAIFIAASLLALVGSAGYFTQIFAAVLPDSALDTGGMARAAFAADAIVLPALVLLSLGALLGAGSRAFTVLIALAATIVLALLSFGCAKLAEQTSYDVALVRAYTVALIAASALLVGAVISVARRRLAFVEQFLVALFASYALYFTAALGPKEWVSQANLPEEQVLLALVVAPVMGLLIALTVGGSFGFLLLGGGRFDAGLGYETSVALRYLQAGRRDRFIGKVTIISIVGVCLGVMSLIVVLSVMSGFEEDLKSKILGAHAHVVLEKTGDDFYEYSDVEARAQEVDGIQSAAAYVLGDGMISSDAGLSGTLVKGIDPLNTNAVAELRQNVDKGSLDHLLRPEEIPGARIKLELDPTNTSTRVDGALPIIREAKEVTGKVLPGIIIGRELSKTLHAYVGDTVKLVSPVSDEIGPMGPQPKLRRFRVAGVFYSGMYEYDAKFTYVEMKQAQTFFGKRDRASGVEIKVSDVDDTPRVVEELKRKVGGYPYKIKDWREMNKELFSALLLEKLAMFIILTFIILVASFNIVATLIMIVLEKGKEIAILKSIGASDASIMKVFVVQGLLVGVGGALLGLTGGVSICALIAKYGVELDQKVFYIERLPVVMSWGEIIAIAAAAVVISYLATIYPAITAAQLRPVEGLRDD
jgi:ABC-type lipoprotein release transport system permease subunit